ncbi:MAG: methyltransferase domain-containing protein [Thermosynechococcaceae cyanobacterium MS004]|nr:methyltransferase domain-containing protein [Thermosynechococcaceae cyanobacterium MS004]
MEFEQIKYFLKENINNELNTYFGIKNEKLVNQVAEEWFNENYNFDGRWAIIQEKGRSARKILDLAAGCGTFLLFGLRSGYDVWGIEPEPWKLEFFRKKVICSEYPSEFLNHMLEGKGESLPFEDNSFDLITSYQTLEHVESVSECLKEMTRVLRPGGFLYLKCPDYDSFFEPHYKLPFMPVMNKNIAEKYIKFMGRPTLGLKTLNWTTEKNIINDLNHCLHSLEIERMSQHYASIRKNKIRSILPDLLKISFLINNINSTYEILKGFKKIVRIFSEESEVDLWITKLS